MQPVFDGHNDVLFRLWNHAAKGADPVAEFRRRRGKPRASTGQRRGHIDMAARQGRRARRRPVRHLHLVRRIAAGQSRTQNGHHATPLAAPLERAALAGHGACHRRHRAAHRAGRRLGHLPRTAPTSTQRWRAENSPPCCTWKAARRSTPTSHALDVFYAAGLRSLGPVWSRNNIFGHGVPFAYPMTPTPARA